MIRASDCESDFTSYAGEIEKCMLSILGGVKGLGARGPGQPGLVDAHG